MNKGRHFLTIKDLMVLMGTENYNSAFKRHKAIREAIAPGKKGLTIKEYCEFECYDQQEIMEMIRSRKN